MYDEYIQQRHAALEARRECPLDRKAQAQLLAQQRLARELKVGRTEVRTAPQKTRPWRRAAL